MKSSFNQTKKHIENLKEHVDQDDFDKLVEKGEKLNDKYTRIQNLQQSNDILTME